MKRSYASKVIVWSAATLVISTGVVVSSACSDSTSASPTSTADAGATGDAATTTDTTDGDIPVALSNPAATVDPDAACGRVVEVGLYKDDQCAPGTEVLLIQYQLDQDCYGWSRDGGSRGTVDNSASHFQCYRDRLCLSQHTQNLACSGGAEDKEQRPDTCTVEPQGDLWTRVLRGTENCPEAPAGFACPSAAQGSGHADIVPATSCGQ